MKKDSNFCPKNLIPAFHGKQKISPDPKVENAMALHYKENLSREEISDLLSEFINGISFYKQTMRRIFLKALARNIGDSVTISQGVIFKHPETFSIGNGVFIGDNCLLQGRHDGNAIIEEGSWIGPQVFLDARNLHIGKNVGIGPSVKILGSQHTGIPSNVPVIQTDLEIKPVIIEDNTDIGTGVTILPGVRVGKGSIIGAGAVVKKDVPSMSIAVGVPAKVIRKR